MKKMHKLQNSVLFCFILLGIVLIIGITITMATQYRSQVRAAYAVSVQAYADAAAEYIDGDKVEQYIDSDGDEEYYDGVMAFLNASEENSNLSHYFVIVPTEEKFVLLWDADKAVESYTKGTQRSFTDEDRELLNNQFTKNPKQEVVFGGERTSGYYAKAYATIYDSSGEPVAMVGAVMQMEGVVGAIQNALRWVIINVIVIIVISLGLNFFFFRKRIVEPINKLNKVARNMVSNLKGEEEIEIDISTGNEIEELANSFENMYSELRDYIDKLYTVTSEKERIGAELDIAQHIQLSMLPCIFPAFPERREFDIYATMDPAKQVGGDFYDFFMVDDRHLAVVMADVSGKGVPAALFMVIGKTLIKDHTIAEKDLGDVFSEVNNLLCESNSEGLFITAFEGVLDLSSGEFRYVNAGHEPPYICKTSEKFEQYAVKPGFVLAGMEDMKFTSGVIQMGEGDKLLLYTDGVNEATNEENELYGLDRLTEKLGSLSDKTPEDIITGIRDDIDDFVGDAPQFDDITMLCLEYVKNMERYRRTINVEATVDNITTVTEFVEECLSDFGCSMKTQMQIDVAIDEIFGNIAHYAYSPEVGNADVDIEVSDDADYVVITFSDAGVPFNPLDEDEPDLTLSADERKIGGLGIHMVRATMDEVSYEYNSGKNILRIKKNL